MKYTRTVIKTPTNKFIIVGSSIPEQLNRVYNNRTDADIALALYEKWDKFDSLTEQYIVSKLKKK